MTAPDQEVIVLHRSRDANVVHPEDAPWIACQSPAFCDRDDEHLSVVPLARLEAARKEMDKRSQGWSVQLDAAHARVRELEEALREILVNTVNVETVAAALKQARIEALEEALFICGNYDSSSAGNIGHAVRALIAREKEEK